MHISGQCFCGEISYRAEIDPERIVVCHCRDCQALSGSAFEVVAVADGGQFQLASGKPREFAKTGANGSRRALAFCPACGTRLYGWEAGVKGGAIALRVGAMDQRRQLTPRLQIWCQSALPWALVPGIPQIDDQLS